MNKSINIRELYTPVQPTIRQSDDNVVYRELYPDLKLQHLIYCYWELKTKHTLTNPFVYRVVSDSCIDVFFDLTNPKDSFVMGFSEKYTEFPLENSFHYVGVRFLPTVFPQLFNLKASELRNRFLELNIVAPHTANYISENFTFKQNEEQIKSIFDAYFLKLVSDVDFNMDSRLYKAIDRILKNSGALNIETDLDTGISPRQLRRLFDFYIGVSAKTFSKVVRFQNILNSKPSSQSLRKNKLYFDVGYFDQAHFIKEFKNFYGVTPARAFRE